MINLDDDHLHHALPLSNCAVDDGENASHGTTLDGSSQVSRSCRFPSGQDIVKDNSYPAPLDDESTAYSSRPSRMKNTMNRDEDHTRTSSNIRENDSVHDDQYPYSGSASIPLSHFSWSKEQFTMPDSLSTSLTSHDPFSGNKSNVSWQSTPYTSIGSTPKDNDPYVKDNRPSGSPYSGPFDAPVDEHDAWNQLGATDDPSHSSRKATVATTAQNVEGSPSFNSEYWQEYRPSEYRVEMPPHIPPHYPALEYSQDFPPNQEYTNPREYTPRYPPPGTQKQPHEQGSSSSKGTSADVPETMPLPTSASAPAPVIAQAPTPVSAHGRHPSDYTHHPMYPPHPQHPPPYPPHHYPHHSTPHHYPAHYSTQHTPDITGRSGHFVGAHLPVSHNSSMGHVPAHPPPPPYGYSLPPNGYPHPPHLVHHYGHPHAHAHMLHHDPSVEVAPIGSGSGKRRKSKRKDKKKKSEGGDKSNRKNRSSGGNGEASFREKPSSGGTGSSGNDGSEKKSKHSGGNLVNANERRILQELMQNAPKPEELNDAKPPHLFVGNLPRKTTTRSVCTYFNQYGRLLTVKITKTKSPDPLKLSTLLQYECEDSTQRVLNAKHSMDSKTLYVRIASKAEVQHAEAQINKQEASHVAGPHSKKVFVGGLSPDVTEEVLRNHFEQYGEVTDAVIMTTRRNNAPRGFGFVTFATIDAVLECLKDEHILCGKRADARISTWGMQGSEETILQTLLPKSTLKEYKSLTKAKEERDKKADHQEGEEEENAKDRVEDKEGTTTAITDTSTADTTTTSITNISSESSAPTDTVSGDASPVQNGITKNETIERAVVQDLKDASRDNDDGTITNTHTVRDSVNQDTVKSDSEVATPATKATTKATMESGTQPPSSTVATPVTATVPPGSSPISSPSSFDASTSDAPVTPSQNSSPASVYSADGADHDNIVPKASLEDDDSLLAADGDVSLQAAMQDDDNYAHNITTTTTTMAPASNSTQGMNDSAYDSKSFSSRLSQSDTKQDQEYHHHIQRTSPLFPTVESASNSPLLDEFQIPLVDETDYSPDNSIFDVANSFIDLSMSPRTDKTNRSKLLNRDGTLLAPNPNEQRTCNNNDRGILSSSSATGSHSSHPDSHTFLSHHPYSEPLTSSVYLAHESSRANAPGDAVRPFPNPSAHYYASRQNHGSYDTMDDPSYTLYGAVRGSKYNASGMHDAHDTHLVKRTQSMPNVFPRNNDLYPSSSSNAYYDEKKQAFQGKRVHSFHLAKAPHPPPPSNTFAYSRPHTNMSQHPSFYSDSTFHSTLSSRFSSNYSLRTSSMYSLSSHPSFLKHEGDVSAASASTPSSISIGHHSTWSQEPVPDEMTTTHPTTTPSHRAHRPTYSSHQMHPSEFGRYPPKHAFGYPGADLDTAHSSDVRGTASGGMSWSRAGTSGGTLGPSGDVSGSYIQGDTYSMGGGGYTHSFPNHQHPHHHHHSYGP